MSTFPGDLSIDQFDYSLPAEKIAVHPLEQRDQSKLLIYKDGKIETSVYQNISDNLLKDSLLVFNNSKVVQARLIFTTETGALIEIFCLEPANKATEINTAMRQTSQIEWRCMVGNLKRWKSKLLKFSFEAENITGILHAELIQKEEDTFIIKFSWTPESLSFAEVLEGAGRVPLPPYIKRQAIEEDKKRYQTIFARHEGSVAAPTAGLHFTPRIFESLTNKNIQVEYLTLHVGAGTFKPVKSETMSGHEMHSEQIVIEKKFLEKLLSHLNQQIVSVGTTSLRTLESIYWMGLKIHLNKLENDGGILIEQWDPYQLEACISPAEAIEKIISYLNKNNSNILIARTQLIIAPGYQWKIVNALVTNFHQPRSTLLLLVAAFIGDEWKDIYGFALNNDFRFLSYGDGSLLFRK